jgi:guanylate kinase
MKPRGRLIVISAPSGGGKTTICNRLLKKDPRLVRSISATTRPMRAGEREGVDYFFLNDAKFDRVARKQEFLEWASVHGNRYGTPAAVVRKNQKAGRDVLLVIDVQGGLAVKRQDPRAVLVFVKPPSFKVLEARLQGRGTDSRGTIRQRLRNARWEMALAPQYDYQVVNNTLAEAVTQIRAIITAERLRTGESSSKRPKRLERPKRA